MNATETQFLNVLVQISNSLRSISKSLESLSAFRIRSDKLMEKTLREKYQKDRRLILEGGRNKGNGSVGEILG